MKFLLLGAVMLPVLALVGVVVVLQLQKQNRALQQRLVRFSARDKAPTPEVSLVLIRPHEQRKRSPAERLFFLIGFDPARHDQYKLPWYVVFGGVVLMGRVIVLLASGLVGPFAWAVLPVVAIFGSRAYYGAADGKRRNLLLIQFLDALALIVRAVQVGIPVPESLRAVAREAPGPTRGGFDRLQHQIAIGTSLETALREMTQRNTLPECGFFAAALSLQAQTGGGLTATLETLADVIRRRVAMKERGHALSSEARTSSMVLGALPVAVGGMLYIVAPQYIGMLFTDPTGHMIPAGAVLSLATGMGVMRMIIRKSLS